MRIGHGYDVHRLVEGRKLILGGVEIPWEKGLLGNSDADVLTHALMDALLGAAGLGDIGHLFPDSDDRYLGADNSGPRFATTDLNDILIIWVENRVYQTPIIVSVAEGIT